MERGCYARTPRRVRKQYSLTGCSRLRASVESLLLFKESPRYFKAKLAYTEARSDRRPKDFNLKAQEDFVSWT